MTRRERLVGLMIALVAFSSVVYIASTPEPDLSGGVSPHREVGDVKVGVHSTLPDSHVAVHAAEVSESVVGSAQGVPTSTTNVPTTSAEVTTDSEHIWQRVADCESGDWTRRNDPTSARPGSADWQSRTGGYEGGLHFLPSTWVQAGGRAYAGHAYEATRGEQITTARLWLGRTSVRQWPTCGPAMGLNKERDGIRDGER